MLEIFNSMFLCQFTDIVGRHSYSYSGLLTLMFVPLYFFALAAMIIASIYLPVYKFMHAFDSPDCFWFRFSFITSFVMCAIAARESLNLYKIKLSVIAVPNDIIRSYRFLAENGENCVLYKNGSILESDIEEFLT